MNHFIERESKIVPIGKYYLYRYIRNDTNSVFYIGIGTKSSKNVVYDRTLYPRAYSLYNRSNHFYNIIGKTDTEVEIIMESSNYNFIKNKEIEFIKLYGRKVDGGTLVNHTSGGDGQLGVKASCFTKALHSKNRAGSKNSNAKKVVNVFSLEIYGCLKYVAKDLGISYDVLKGKLNGSRPNNTKFVYLENYILGVMPVKAVTRPKKVIDLDSGTIFDSVKKCAKFLGMAPSNLSQVIRKRIKPKKVKLNIEYYDM